MSVNSEKARSVLKVIFPFTETTTQYVAVYKNNNGRELALERERSEAYYLWLERYNCSIDGVVIKNQRNPRQPYGAKQSRNSNLNDKNTPRLKIGNTVWYLEIATLSALENVAKWYSTL